MNVVIQRIKSAFIESFVILSSEIRFRFQIKKKLKKNISQQVLTDL